MRLSDTAFAKINLALHVRKRRADGYHELETLFAFAEDGDFLSAEPADTLTLSIVGPFAEGLSTGPDNLVLRAAAALAECAGIHAGAAFTLDKRLPIASGIGGGSADAAAALRLAARLWGLDDVRPMDVAAQIGADVPACVLSQTCIGTHLGDRLEQIDGSELAGLPLLLVNPMVPCPTGPVFHAWDGIDRGALDVAHWMTARNDLQPPALALVPEIGAALDVLAKQPGNRLTRMSGSGATCFALFDTLAARDIAAATIADEHPSWWTLATRLR